MTAMRLTRPAPLSAAVAGVLAVFITVGLFGARSYVNNFLQFRGFPPPREPAFVTHPGTLHRLLVPSPALGGRAQEVYVYLPSGYAQDPHRRYPVLYLLHGFPGRPLAFIQTVQMGIIDDTLTSSKQAAPLILVMPYGSTSTFTDKEWANGISPNDQWATFVARDVVAAVDARYRTIPTGAGRGIGGLSEGGYGAINIALQHPQEFSVVESWSGYERPDPLRSLFGTGLQLLAANDPRLLLPRVAPVLRARRMYFWFYSGSKDQFQSQNAAFAQELARAHVAHHYFRVFGGHNWAIWRNFARAAYIAAASRLGLGSG
jgi:enterochelin esterase-like enzyme